MDNFKVVPLGTRHPVRPHPPGQPPGALHGPHLFFIHIPSRPFTPLSLGSPLTSASDSALIAHLLRHAFPSVTSLTFYARNPSTIQLVAPQWPNLEHVKLVRWHQRPQIAAAGDELKILISECGLLRSLDLSAFYCWTDDVPPALESYPSVASSLTCLNLLNPSFSEGFKSDEIKVITKACPSLREFRAASDTSALSNVRGDPEDDGFTQEDARINVATLIEVFSGLPLLEELALDVCNNVRDSGPALEMLNSKCPKLRSLKLGLFHGVSMPVESKLDGVALCQGLESLSIRNVGDLDDMGLIAIARGCCRLTKFEVHGCKKITMRGMRTFTCLLSRTLVDVRISCCKNLGAAPSLKALEPIQDRIERLHIDCIWDCAEELEDLDGIEGSFDLNSSDQGEISNHPVEQKHFRTTVMIMTMMA
ncbi:UNVERIFIED_CONTAM: F-box/LRR-repeat MAX2A [Sesamum radiatum]|uniref:F-box/LRR-repeat MAX2A n=1 Tax=Sesamum radiatum TaxID=300843 RepID=A0AAW2KIP2_SESRA